MSLLSQRSSEFQKVTDKLSATFSSERDSLSGHFSTVSSASQRELLKGSFGEASKDGAIIYRKRRVFLPSARNRQSESGSDNNRTEFRMSAGEAKAWSCKFQPPIDFITQCKHKNQTAPMQNPAASHVAVINVELKNFKKVEKSYDNNQYKFLGVKSKRMLTKTRGTQTLYRESSAQTLPFLPAVSNNTQELDNLELFRLPTILPGDGPPGLYEVEVLERARKRWAFTKALKANFKRQIEKSKENISSAAKSHIIEAFEWEMWMEREEHIQECQMLRLEIVIRMFENRERQMHDASRFRLAKSMEIIQAERQAGLRKNEIDFGRQLRRLDMQKLKISRNWQKENITNMFDDPKSEFYAPQMRYGVNPNRRHFISERNAFETSIDALEIKAININKLMCPFAKLKEWSRPKLRLKEVEQNFCSDVNLKKLYDSLKQLRLECGRQKQMPKCLKEKVKLSTVELEQKENIDFSVEDSDKNEDPKTEKEKPKISEQESDKANAKALMVLQETKERKRSLLLNAERRNEELEALLEEYEGSTVGWLMKFLSDEMQRLEEQRNLHFFTMLAQKERWRREAAEAGLRQKENDMRIIYEEIFQQTNEANVEVCTEYLNNIMDVDIKEYADQKASASIIKLAKVIDMDIQRWIDSVESVQNPLNYRMLRYLLKDIIFPNAGVLIKRYETELIIDGIIYEDIFPYIEKLLEPYDVAFTISNELIDRLIDNDICYFSDDSSGSSITAANQQEHEARAILRKLIRRAVPGRRWMTSYERLADANIGELLDNVFDNIKNKEEQLKKEQEAQKLDENLISQGSYLNLVQKKPRAFTFINEANSDELMCFMKSDIYVNKENDELNQAKDDGTAVRRRSVETEDKLVAHTKEIKITEEVVESSATDQVVLEQAPPSINPNLEAIDIRIFLQEIIMDIVKEYIPEDTNEDLVSPKHLEVTENSEDLQESEPKAFDHIQLRKVNNIEEVKASEVESTKTARIEDINEEYEEEDVSLLSVNESELDLLKVIKCKCKKEIQRENLIRKKLEQKRVKIIRKPKIDEYISYSERSVDTIETFGYETDSLSSSHKHILQDEGEDQLTTTTSDFPPIDYKKSETEVEELTYYEEQYEEGASEIVELTENTEKPETTGVVQAIEKTIGYEDSIANNVRPLIEENVDSPIEDTIAPPLVEHVEESPKKAPLTERNNPNQDDIEDNSQKNQDSPAESAVADVPTYEIINEIPTDSASRPNEETDRT